MLLNTTSEITVTYTSDEILAVIKADAIRRNLITTECDIDLFADKYATEPLKTSIAVLKHSTGSLKEIPVDDPSRTHVLDPSAPKVDTGNSAPFGTTKATDPVSAPFGITKDPDPIPDPLPNHVLTADEVSQ